MSAKIALLRIASRLLDYPEDSTISDLSNGIYSEARSLELPELTEMIHHMLTADPITLQEAYVRTFEIGGNTPLYLTAWEMGSSRDRGAKILELKRLILNSGFQIEKKELPDYIPLLLEFLAQTEEDDWPDDLESRIKRYCTEMAKTVRTDNYRSIFALLSRHLRESGVVVNSKHEDIDTVQMPFPLRYEPGGE